MRSSKHSERERYPEFTADHQIEGLLVSCRAAPASYRSAARGAAEAPQVTKDGEDDFRFKEQVYSRTGRGATIYTNLVPPRWTRHRRAWSRVSALACGDALMRDVTCASFYTSEVR